MNPCWFRPCSSMADWKESLKLQHHLPMRVFNAKGDPSVWLHQSRNLPLTLLYRWILFYPAVLKELRRAQWYLLLWIYYLGCTSSCPSVIATFARKCLDFFHLEEPQFNHPVRPLIWMVCCSDLRHLYLQAAFTLRRAVSPLASLKFDGQVFEDFPADKLKQKYICGKGFDKISKWEQIPLFSAVRDCGLLFVPQRFGFSV